MIRKKIAHCFILLIAAVFIICCERKPNPAAEEATYLRYCGSCHLAPDPAQIPSTIWTEFVLPNMAERMGYSYQEHENPLSIYSMEEELFSSSEKKAPLSPDLDDSIWQQIQEYIQTHAPDSIPVERHRNRRNSPLVQFSPQPISLGNSQLGGITHMAFDSISKQFRIGDYYGRLFTWPDGDNLSPRFQSPVIFQNNTEEGLFITEIGYMDPSEESRGKIYRIGADGMDTIAMALHRPVFSELTDLNEDGVDEMLICEFGDLTGELSLLVKTDLGYEKRTLLGEAGTIKVEIQDMNRDGRKDIVVLATQGNEGIYILYQEGDLLFRQEQVIQMGPEYGSSWFEMLDYDRDGDLDLVIANGDNADFSIFLKPYHGVRLFLNDGQNAFEQQWFYPIYGATRVLAEDYDLDGDWDFAVMAYFPDFDNSPEEAFIFLENKDPNRFQFEPHTLQEATNGRWLVMEDGDYDGDGDIDIMLGSFLLLPGDTYETLMKHWKNKKTHLLLLKNTVKD